MSESILLVDDEVAVLNFMKELLEVNGYKVDACSSGDEAYALYRSNPENYQLLITDQSMPAMLGKELIVKVNHVRPVSAILCTGHNDNFEHSLSEKEAVIVYVQKPFSSTAFLEQVNTLFSRNP